jgi:hypothetical protein
MNRTTPIAVLLAAAAACATDPPPDAAGADLSRWEARAVSTTTPIVDKTHIHI